ncbi:MULTISPECIES: hypothetical protein [unclassified Tenacibaculum]|uniref:hypothetical protein n=1 Tax=unclassified Tenacibaculum TaxID=2635139 RepID=UPI001F457830|nr:MULTISPECIES: hypothetical protein [unclassified Tenacibaculum]MCF2875433.1 hypothetical protein [Tenacibaculum sp. Cn5-1]MCF2935509.1 hypothetical protein [Tenacibaculum sp. Cn5-34]MCG7512069.1 hypothetical protein [Tenacibaculum sp. Cn5-46]
MEKAKLPKKKQEQKGSFPTGILATMAIAIFGYAQYTKFINFIDSVRFRIVLVQKNERDIITFISPLSGLNIPYKIENIELFLDNHIWKVQGSDLHKKIVANSQIPISIKAYRTAQNNTDQPIMAVTYSLCGYTVKRGYQPEIIRNENQQRPGVELPQVSRPNNYTQKKPCSCKKQYS